MEKWKKLEEQGVEGSPPGVGPRASWRLEPALELRPKLQRAFSSPAQEQLGRAAVARARSRWAVDLSP